MRRCARWALAACRRLKFRRNVSAGYRFCFGSAVVHVIGSALLVEEASFCPRRPSECEEAVPVYPVIDQCPYLSEGLAHLSGGRRPVYELLQ